MTQSPPPRPDATHSDLEIPQVARLLRRAALPVLGVTALAGGGAYLLANSQPKVYEATSSLFTEQSGGNNALNDSLLRPSPLPRGGLQQALHSPAVVKLVINRLRSSETAPATIAKVQRELEAELSSGSFSRLRVEPDPNGSSNNSNGGGVFILSARANTPELARVLANSSVAALQLWDIQRAQRRSEQARAALKLQLDVLDRTAQMGGLSTDDVNRQARASIVRDLAVITSSRQSVAGTLDVIAEAVNPSRPVTPRPVRTAALAALLTLLFAGGGAVLLGSRRRTTQVAVVDQGSMPEDAPALYRREASEARNVTSTLPQR